MTQSLAPRLMMSALCAALATVLLFLLMKVLVTGRNYQIEKTRASIGIDFVRVEREEDVNAKNRAMKRPSQEEPDDPPPPPKLQQASRPNMDKAAMQVDFGQFDLGGMNLNAPVDGDALAIARVLPPYPSRAQSRGIEGWVVLEFAINELGQAIDPVVIDAEPRGVFDSTAIRAVKKWKYHPMIEDGNPKVRQGVRQLMSFRLTKEGG